MQGKLVTTFVTVSVRGYSATTAEYRQQLMDANYEQETIRELSQKKQALAMELSNYEQAKKLSEMNSAQQAQAIANQDIACIAVSILSKSVGQYGTGEMRSDAVARLLTDVCFS